MEIKPPVPLEITTSPQNTQKQNLKDFTVIERDSNTLHYWANEVLHICIKDPSFKRYIGKVRIPSVFNKLLKPHTQLEHPHSSIPPPKQGTFFTWSLNTKTINSSHLLDLHLQKKCHPYVHTFQISSQLNL